jgi:hypothetical protein
MSTQPFSSCEGRRVGRESRHAGTGSTRDNTNQLERRGVGNAGVTHDKSFVSGVARGVPQRIAEIAVIGKPQQITKEDTKEYKGVKNREGRISSASPRLRGENTVGEKVTLEIGNGGEAGEIASLEAGD